MVFVTLIQDIYPMTIYDVYDSHMDKLVESMIANATSSNVLNTMGLSKNAGLLNIIWQRMFGNKWADIDKMRMNDMLGGTVRDITTDGPIPQVVDAEQRGGILRGMSMGLNTAVTCPVFSAPITTFAAARAQQEGAVTFRPGQ